MRPRLKGDAHWKYSRFSPLAGYLTQLSAPAQTLSRRFRRAAGGAVNWLSEGWRAQTAAPTRAGRITLGMILPKLNLLLSLFYSFLALSMTASSSGGLPLTLGSFSTGGMMANE